MARSKSYVHPFVVGVVALFASGCAGRAEIPDTPDLQGLVAEYQAPTAELDEFSIEEALAMAPNIEALAAGFNSIKVVRPGIDAANGSLQRDGDSAVRLQGSLRVTVTCPGDGPEPTLDAGENGTLGLTLAVQDTQIKRGVALQANRCRARPSFAGVSLNAYLDGPIALDLGRNLGSGEGALALLLRLDGEARFGDFEFTAVSGRVTEDSFESLFVLPSGGTVVFTSREGEGIGIRDHESFWRCNLDTQECSRE